MTFSHRLPQELGENAVTRALDERRRSGAPIIDLTESNPTLARFTYPAALLAPLGDPRGLTYHPAPLGLPDARQAVAEDAARRQIAIDPGRIMLTVSTSEAYSTLFKLLCDPGDEVLVPQPSYPLFEHLSRLDGVVCEPYRLEYHGRWSIDMPSVERAVTPRTRALLLVSPNNPTGSVVTNEELAGLADLCTAHNLAIISDEVFADYPLDVSAPAAAALATRPDVLGFTLGGLSKSVGLPQVKLAWTTVSGPDDLVGVALARLEIVCDTYLSLSTPVQLGLREILVNGASVRAQIQNRIRANYAHCQAAVDRYPACTLLRADGGWSAVIRVPRVCSEEELVLSLIEDAGVLVHPGYFFDFAEEAYLVVSLLVPHDTFAEGLGRVLDRFGSDGRV